MEEQAELPSLTAVTPTRQGIIMDETDQDVGQTWCYDLAIVTCNVGESVTPEWQSSPFMYKCLTSPTSRKDFVTLATSPSPSDREFYASATMHLHDHFRSQNNLLFV